MHWYVFFVTTCAFDGIDVVEANVGPTVGGVTERAVTGVVVGGQHVTVTIQAGLRAAVVVIGVAPRSGVVTGFTTAGIVRRLCIVCVAGRAGG